MVYPKVKKIYISHEILWSLLPIGNLYPKGNKFYDYLK